MVTRWMTISPPAHGFQSFDGVGVDGVGGDDEEGWAGAPSAYITSLNAVKNCPPVKGSDWPKFG
jgi:hypothetical protein